MSTSNHTGSQLLIKRQFQGGGYPKLTETSSKQIENRAETLIKWITQTSLPNFMKTQLDTHLATTKGSTSHPNLAN